MNPYDFVRLVWQRPDPRHPAPPGDRWSGVSGRLEGTITALTPLFLPDKRSGGLYKTFLRDHQGRWIIPGSSLKGLFRSLVETVGGGAWWFFGRNGVWRDTAVVGAIVDYSAMLPPEFQRPRRLDELDAACRMFGFLERNVALAGNVGFEDAVCAAPVSHDAIYTCVLSTPKPRHRIWYLDGEQQLVAGRKFYFHSTSLATASGWLPRNDVFPEQRQNAYIKPVGTGSVFTFRAQFNNVGEDDFALLLYALVLEPEMRHKLGYAKPAGLGSVEVRLTWLETVDYAGRYRAGGGGMTRYEHNGPDGDTLTPFVQRRIAPFSEDRASVTLQDLRRIWRWPPVVEQHYPSLNWFKDHPQAPIDDTP